MMLVRLAVFVALGMVVAAVAVPAAFSVNPEAQIDQSQGTTEGCVTFTPGTLIGQVFTAGVSGRLSDLLLTLGNSSGAAGAVRAVLTGVDGASQPELAAEIARIDVPAGSIPAPGAGTVDLEFGDPSLVAGTQYAVVVSTSDAAGFDICGAGSIDFYAAGQALGSIDAGATWADVGGDAHFSTYMLLPSAGRAGYCLNGEFLDLVTGQPDTDPSFKGATPALYYQDKGISCDNLPGYTKTGEMVGYGGHGDPGGYTYMVKN